MFFWNSHAFSMIQQMLAIWSLVPLPFLKPDWTSGSSQFTYCWSLAWRIFSITLLVRWVQLCGSLSNLWHCLSLGLEWVSKLKWTEMGEFNSDDHYIYYSRKKSLRRNGVAIVVNKRVRNAVLGCNLKNDRMISVRLQGKPFNITVIQVYADKLY